MVAFTVSLEDYTRFLDSMIEKYSAIEPRYLRTDVVKADIDIYFRQFVTGYIDGSITIGYDEDEERVMSTDEGETLIYHIVDIVAGLSGEHENDDIVDERTFSIFQMIDTFMKAHSH